MKKFAKVLAAALVCALAVLAAAACSSPQVSRSTESLAVESEAPESSASSDATYVLLVGNDSRYGTAEENGVTEDDPSFGDTIMLMRLDPEENRIGIVSVPRDTATDMDGRPEKINAVHYYFGGQGLAKEVGDMFGIEVPYYFDMKFIDFAALVDRLGGVTVDVPQSLTGGDILSGEDISLSAGVNDLDGASALMLSRQRKVYAANGEAVRQMISRDMVANAIQKVANDPDADASAYAEIIESFGETNMSEDQLAAYIQAFMDNDDPIDFSLGTLPYAGGVDDSGVWRIARDADLYQQVKAVLEEGGDLTALVPLPAV